MPVITFFFLSLIPYAANSITFNFTSFTPNHIKEIVLSGDAAYDTSGGSILVTNGRNSTVAGWKWLAGRATYMKPLHLWDKDSNQLASFSTSFTFVINVHMASNYGDGLSFFLAQNNSVMNSAANLGLPFDVDTNTSIDPFVAVEFDSYGNNGCDPYDIVNDCYVGDHVGININSMSSVVYRKWLSDIWDGLECKALIEYDSRLKILSVGFTRFNNSSPVWETGLNYTVDLRRVLPESVIFGISAATGNNYEENILKSWVFNSTELKGDEKLVFTPTEKNTTRSNNPTTTTDQNSNNTGVVVGFIAGLSFLVVVLLSVLVYFLWMKYKYNGDTLKEPVKKFAYQELATSTEGFADTTKLISVGSGAFYKGFLKDSNKPLAVKRVYNTSIRDVNQYSSEVKVISQLIHPNLVPLVGWCHEEQELLLIYEFFENGSLDLHLFGRDNLLTWNTRYIIARGLASALISLHEKGGQFILHRDIKSSNVMLDSNLKARLGDFGFAKLVNHENNMIAGTVGYIAPEYLATRKASKESDVYSFGVVALEIASGRSAIDIHGHGETNLVKWVWDLYGTGKLLEAADPRLNSNFAEEEMKCLMSVGLWCAHPDSKYRPSMKQAFQVLNSEASLPQLPPNMPM